MDLPEVERRGHPPKRDKVSEHLQTGARGHYAPKTNTVSVSLTHKNLVVPQGLASVSSQLISH